VRCASFRPDGKFISVGTNDRALTICGLDFNTDDASGANVAVVTVLKVPGYHQGSVYSAEWSPDGSLLATAGNDKRVKVATFRSDDDAGRGPHLAPCLTLDGHNGTVRDLAFLDASRLVSAGAGDCAVRVWDVGEGRADPLVVLTGHADAVWSVDAGGGGRVLTAAADGCVKWWDLRGGHQAASAVTFHGPGAACCAAAWPGSTQQVACSFRDGLVALFDARRPDRVLCELYRHAHEARSVEFRRGSFGARSAGACVTAAFDGTAAVHALGSDDDGGFFAASASVRHDTTRVVRARWHPAELAFLSCTDSDVALWTGQVALDAHMGTGLR
jgi:WD40 repeat protein